MTIPDPLQTAVDHLRCAEDALRTLLEAPHTATNTQKGKLLQEIKRLITAQMRLSKLKVRTPPRPPRWPFGKG
jgi:hypothetical protein